MSKVPMGQMCLYGNCTKDATKKIDGMYFCNDHPPISNKIKIEGYIARDISVSKTMDHDTHFFNNKPTIYKSNAAECYSGSIFHIPEILQLKRGECREVEIVITVLH